MKRLLILLAAGLLLAALPACRKEELPPSQAEPETSEESGVEEPDLTTPAGALTVLLDSAKRWDTAAIDARLPDGSTISSYVPAAFDSVISSLLRRMEYKVGDSSADGDTAAVQVELTTVDAESALGDAVAKMVAQIAKQQLTGQPVDDYIGLLDEVVRSIDIDGLPTTTTTSTAYMILGSDGMWRLDISNESNLPLLNAVTGGTVDMAQKLRQMAESYGISLDSFSKGG